MESTVKTLEPPREKKIYLDENKGLSESDVLKRVKDGLTNTGSNVSTKSVSQIVKGNLFTLFNIVNFILALAIAYTGSFKNLTFMGVVLSNLVIGIVQEIRSKKTIDKLAILSASKVLVIRDGKEKKINTEDLVQDDIIILNQGDQIPSDSIVISGECQANESLLTGESDYIDKRKGDSLYSGSYVVSGKCKARVKHVGKSNYAYSIYKEAKNIKKVSSEMMKTFKKIILIISIFILPIGFFLFLNQLSSNSDINSAIVSTAAALIGMIPEGLVLLTSSVLAVSVVRLSKYKVLVQELYCIETLARVDVMCLDKTGTLTEGTMYVDDLVPIENSKKEDIEKYLSLFVNSSLDNNPTLMAIKQKYKDVLDEAKLQKADQIIPFSSEKKWSGVYFKEHGSFLIGAAEFIFSPEDPFYKKIMKSLDVYGKENRVIVLAKSNEEFKNKNLPQNLEPLAYVLIKDTLRKDAKETIGYFGKQDVEIKIISGDNARTVSNIAKTVGVKNSEKFIDLSKVKDEDDLEKIALEYTIFGRVTPAQKQKILKALKKKGHTVAMVGDGVNDVLALKEADCSVALASGSSAAKNVSQLVLLNSDFSSMPKVLHEGRRTINNIQRSSSLFLVKTIYSTLLAILFLFIHMKYPFEPIQMTLTSVLTIGIPSFILALEPNKDRISGNFLHNIMGKAFPGGVSIVLSVALISLLSKLFGVSNSNVSTLSVISTSFIGFLILFNVCKPFNVLRTFLFTLMCAGMLIGVIFFKQLFSLSSFTIFLAIASLLVIFIDLVIFKFAHEFTKKFIEKRNLKKNKAS